MRRNTGFTLIEILGSMAVILVIAGIVMVPFSKLRNQGALNSEVENVLSLLSTARHNTLGSTGLSEYGVHFENTRAVLFKGDTFTEPSTDNVEHVFDSAIEMIGISLNGGGADVVFNKLTGESDEYGTVTLRQVNNTSASTTINILQTGAVELD